MSAAPWPPQEDAQYRAEAERRLGRELADRFARVRALVLDADGILTDGGLVYGPQGEALKVFHAHDGFGLVMARTAGLKLAILSGRRSEPIACRARELGFHAVRQGRYDKLEALAGILAEVGVPAAEVLYAGDDLLDLPAMGAVGVPATVPAAPPPVRRFCAYTTAAGGGRGAVRELCDLVLMSRGEFARTLRRLSDPAAVGDGAAAGPPSPEEP